MTPPFVGAIAAAILQVQQGQHGYSGRNVRLWPCVSGEDFPPVFSGSPAPSYNARVGRPAVIVAPQSPAATILWPRLPRRSIDGLPNLRLRFQTLWNGGPPGATSTIIFGYGGNNNPASTGVWLEINLNAASGGWTSGSADGAGGATTETALGASTAPAANTWQEWSILLTATAVNFYLNGVRVAQHTTDLWTVANTTGGIQPFLEALQAGGSATEFAVGLVEASWEAA